MLYTEYYYVSFATRLREDLGVGTAVGHCGHHGSRTRYAQRDQGDDEEFTHRVHFPFG